MKLNLNQAMIILNKRYLLCIASIFLYIFVSQEEVKLNLLRPIKQLTQIVLGMEKKLIAMKLSSI